MPKPGCFKSSNTLPPPVLKRIANISYFRELASQWWINRSEVRRDAPTLLIAFKAAVRERFQPVAASRTARAELRSLRQGSGSVATIKLNSIK